MPESGSEGYQTRRAPATIREGKGGKDRMVPLPEAALQDLEQWWLWHRHPRLLFPAMGRSWKATLQRGQAERDRLQREQLHGALHPMSDSALQNAWRIALAADGARGYLLH